MKIGKKFNQLSISEYKHYIYNYKKYKDFNTLGLYRSIGENEKLTTKEKIEIRDFANRMFRKTFDFELITLGKELTKGEENQIWEEIRFNQKKILDEKRIKHRNFGSYSKHNCGYDDCPMNGIMVKQGSWFTYRHLWFDSGKNKYSRKEKSEGIKKERKSKSRIIRDELENN